MTLLDRPDGPGAGDPGPDPGMSASAEAAPARSGTLLPVALAAAVAGGGVLVAALLTGRAVEQRPPGDLPYPGAGTEWALPVARLLHDVTMVLTVGFLLLAVALIPDRKGKLGRPAVAAMRRARYLAAAAVVAVLAEAILNLSDVAAAPVPRILSFSVVFQYLTHVTEGQVSLGVLLCAAIVAAAPPVRYSNPAAVLLGVALLGLMLPPLLTGHSTSASNHDLAMTSLLVHVVGAGLWVGGLAAICWLAASRRPDLGVALPRFSAMALGCFVAVALSGVLNAAIRLGRVEALWQDRYGLLVIGKALLLVVLGGFGYRHRRQTVGPAVAGERRAFARLAGVELAFMAAAFGLAVALSRSPTPVARSVPDVSVAKAALGYELPGPASARTLALSWEPQLLFVLLVLAGAVGYVLGLRRLRARGEFWSGWRSTAWAAGLLVVLVATQSGLSRYGGVLFSVHIVQQMLLALVAPPLLVLGAPVALALRTLPVNSTGYRGARGWLRAALRSSTLRLLTRPFVALGLLLASTFALYFSAVFEALMRQHADHLAMELYFLVLGCLAFWPILGSEAMPHRPRRGLRLLSAALILPGYAAFGLALRSASSPLAVGWFGQLGRTWGASVLADQRTGATLVLVIGAAAAIGTALAAWRSASESIGPRSSDSTVEPARIRA